MIGSMWSLNKWEVLNSIDAEFVHAEAGKENMQMRRNKMKLERVLPFARSLLQTAVKKAITL